MVVCSTQIEPYASWSLSIRNPTSVSPGWQADSPEISDALCGANEDNGDSAGDGQQNVQHPVQKPTSQADHGCDEHHQDHHVQEHPDLACLIDRRRPWEEQKKRHPSCLKRVLHPLCVGSSIDQATCIQNRH